MAFLAAITGGLGFERLLRALWGFWLVFRRQPLECVGSDHHQSG
jgi:hypothetical protein